MKTVVHKYQSLGPSAISLVEPTLQLGHFLYEVSELPSAVRQKGYLAVFVCEIALVEYFKPSAAELQETYHVRILHKRLADVVDLSAYVSAFGVRQKQDVGEEKRSGSKVDDSPVRTLPNGMELCFDVDIGDLPDCPARQLSTAMCGNMLWNNRETFVEWLSKKWHAFDQIGRAFASH